MDHVRRSSVHRHRENPSSCFSIKEAPLAEWAAGKPHTDRYAGFTLRERWEQSDKHKNEGPGNCARPSLCFKNDYSIFLEYPRQHLA